MSRFKEFSEFDAIGLAELVRKREVSPVELCEETIERIERVNPQLNAVIAKLYDRAIVQAKAGTASGPFAGVPFLLKDLLSPLAGVPFTSGSRLYRNFVPKHDAEMVRRYKAAGFNIVGKTSTPEFGILPVTEPVLFGPCRNPWDISRTPGGSSGGAAAMVAAGVVPAAHGGDGGGSIRIPASCCALFGLKPTRGRNPAGPDASEHWLGMAIEHVLTRSVRDSAAILDVTSGPEATSPYWAPPPHRPFLEEVGTPPGRLRIAFTDVPHLPSEVHPDCRAALRDAVSLCRELGHEVVEASPALDGESVAHAFFTVIAGSIAAGISLCERELGRRPAGDDLEISTWLGGLLGEQMSAGDAIAAQQLLQHYARIVHEFYRDYDVLLTPTLGSPPLKIGDLEPTGAERLAHKTIANLKFGSVLRLKRVIKATVNRVFAFVPFTPLANITGQPSMSVPLFWNAAGLPIGTNYTARFGDEATLFRLAAQLEAARPWIKRRPRLHSNA
ncbi:MAG TPA: amidase [Polyangiaceae bacterium]|nr:amidase [Polyangiaceae bacterium]